MYFDETYPLRSTFHAKQHSNMLYLLPNKHILKVHNKNNRTTMVLELQEINQNHIN